MKTRAAAWLVFFAALWGAWSWARTVQLPWQVAPLAAASAVAAGPAAMGYRPHIPSCLDKGCFK